MKHFSLFTGVTLCGAALFFSACDKSAEKPAVAEAPEVEAVAAVVAETPVVEVAPPAELSLETLESRVSYGIGYNIGRNFSQREVDVQVDAVVAGLEDALAQKDLRIDEALIAAAFQEMEQKAQAAQAVAGEAAAAEGQAWLAANGQQPGITTTPSGLQYEVITAGDGDSPEASDTVEVHYHGTLIDGTVFDSSVQRGETVKFPVTGVIPGWVEALQLMKVGDKWRLFIPSELAYGPRGQGPIPPNSVLLFEVELIGIEGKPAAEPSSGE